MEDKRTTWTEEEERKLIYLWNDTNLNGAEIGKVLSKNYKATIAKISRLKRRGVYLKLKRGKVKTNSEEAERKCLRCRQYFLSESRFNKICKGCAKKNATVFTESMTGVLL